MDNKNPKSCSKLLDQNKPDGPPYAALCPTCKLFGCTSSASRIKFTDADIAPGYHSVYRDMIGIDRFTGGVFHGESGGANMRFHVLENTAFITTVTVTNFELWQLGLLAYIFHDFSEGLVPLGFGKTKGFGSVKGVVDKIALSYPTGRCKGGVQHMGSLLSDDEKKLYGLSVATAADCDGLQRDNSSGLNLYETFSVTKHDAFWAAVAPAFNEFIEVKSKEIQP